MDERFTNSLITSSMNYLINLQYLAKNPPRLVKDLNLFKIIHQVYMWADWFNIDQPTQLELQKKMEYLTLNNTDLALLTPFTNTYYSNVSSPQTISTWTRIWDDPNVVTYDDVNLGTTVIVPPVIPETNNISASDAEVISLTYSDLVTWVSKNMLVPGQKYLINDYQTVHIIPNTSDVNTGPVEPLLVTASSTNTLEPIAYSTIFPQDIIYYNIENDQDMVPGSTKGYIYRRIDTLQNNDIGLDYRNVKFRRWQINVTTSDSTGSGSTYSQGAVVLQTGTNNIYLKLDNTPSVPFTNTTSWMLFPWSNLQYVSPTNNNYIINNYTIPVSNNYMDYTMFSTEPTTEGVQCNYDYIYGNTIGKI